MLLASVDGVIGPVEDARIPVTDEGLLRGDGAFEVVRLYAGRPFAMDEHLARLHRTCVGLRLELDHDRLVDELDALLLASGPADALLRVVVTRGGRRLAMLEELPAYGETARVGTVAYAPNRVLDGLKTLSYAGNMLATRLAREEGFEEALLVTPHGRVLEGPTWSFFWVSGAQVFTPPLSDRILGSITRAHVIAACGAEEAVCTLDDVRAADEAFIASTVREVLPIAAVDDIELPSAPGPVTVDARDGLRRRIEAALAVG
jgi:branched-chain amino acid aminotransferase